MIKAEDLTISIIGLGYVGLPLAVEFGKKFKTIGYDIDGSRITELRAGKDKTKELTKKEIELSSFLEFSSDPNLLESADFFIISVPTPIDKNNSPDLSILRSACNLVGTKIKKGSVVIFESTVYPGCTEEFCVPLLQEASGLILNTDFFCGYSPERINPGDKNHRITEIVKVTSGSNEESSKIINWLYSEIISAGTYEAKSIKVAEAAKVIENTQRDLNIALMNEFSVIFNKLGIKSKDVLNAASTKWNFLNFYPGLVGGHCIGVDPYYLTYKAESVGYKPEVILAGRKINDSLAERIGLDILDLLASKGITPNKSKALILGVTFKENCPDIRNTKVVDLIEFLNLHCIDTDVYDPVCDHTELKKEYGISIIENIPKNKKYELIVLAVGHDEFKKLTIEDIEALSSKVSVIYDIKNFFKEIEVDGSL